MRKLIIVFLALTVAMVFVGCNRHNPLTDVVDPEVPQADVYSLSLAPSTVILERGKFASFDVIIRRVFGAPHRFAITLKDESGASPWWFQPVYVYVNEAVRKTIRIKAMYPQVESGVYVVRAEAVDSQSGGLALEQNLTVVKKEEHLVTPPVAVINYSPSTVYIGTEVVFDGSSSYDEDGYIRNFKWWVDGQLAQVGGWIFRWSFASAGYHTVTLEVVDNDGAVGSTAVLIEVQTP